MLDGEVAIYDEQLRSHFDWLREPDPDAVATPPLFTAFDVLHRDGRDLSAGRCAATEPHQRVFVLGVGAGGRHQVLLHGRGRAPLARAGVAPPPRRLTIDPRLPHHPSVDRRRFLLTSLAGAFAAPLAIEAQQAVKGKVYRVGFIWPETPTPARQESFWDRMRELGWVHGQNVVSEQRAFGADVERVPELARELIGLGTDVFLVVNANIAGRIRRETRTIPIVTTNAGDLVAAGLADSVARPGGNGTGLQVMATELGGKQLSLLKEALPGLKRVGILAADFGLSEANMQANPQGPTAVWIHDLRTRAAALGLQLQVVVVGEASGGELERAFASFKSHRAQAIVVNGSSLVFSYRKTIADLALTHRLPTIHVDMDLLPGGYLMCYGWDREANIRLAAEFVDKILRGAKAGDIPIQQPTIFRLGINLKTAKALGLTIPPSLLARADQVIE